MIPRLSCILLLLLARANNAAGEKNVLFIMADDLRPEIGAYIEDNEQDMNANIITPNLDALATKSLVLKRNYAQQALCCPSRTSIMTGRRPDTTGVTAEDYWRTVGGNFTSLPQHFKNNGYTSYGMGKIYHPGAAAGSDDPLSWSDDYYHAPNKGLYSGKTVSWKSVPENRQNNYPLPDQQIRDHAIEKLGEFAPTAKLDSGAADFQPFFLAVGFYKPHLPFVFPESYLTDYPSDEVELATNAGVPSDFPDRAWFDYDELRGYTDISDTGVVGDYDETLPDDKAKELRRAYYCTVSYIDDMVGAVIDELDTLGLADNTIVVFASDHGWQLGEHNEWAKQTNFEIAVRTPLMIHIPGVTDAGISTTELSETVDIFPTVVEAAGLGVVDQCPEDSSEVDVCHEGLSLIPFATGSSVSQWRSASFSQYPRVYGAFMGYTMRTSQYRYTEWVKVTDDAPVWTRNSGTELYDHDADAEENVNLAYDVDYADIVASLSAQLQDGWRSSVPSTTARTLSKVKEIQHHNQRGSHNERKENKYDTLVELLKKYLHSQA